MSFDMLIEKVKQTNNPTVAGLDPKIDYIPQIIRDANVEKYGDTFEAAANMLLDFNKGLIDALCDIVPAVKPQSAYYEMYGWQGVKALSETIKYAKSKGMYVIADVKRGDIGATSEAYSSAYLGETTLAQNTTARAFESDCATINPYLGTDGIKPFITDCAKHDKTVFVLVKTSNPSSGELQDIQYNGAPIFEHMAGLVKKWGEGTEGKYGYSAAGAVVGATYPQQLKDLRRIMPNTYFLVPGYGAQGGKAEDVAHAFNDDGLGAIINASRSIMCAYMKTGEDYQTAARNEAIKMREALKFS